MVLPVQKRGRPIFRGNFSAILQPVRLVSLGIGQKILLSLLVVGAIGNDGVIVPIDIRHGLRRL